MSLVIQVFQYPISKDIPIKRFRRYACKPNTSGGSHIVKNCFCDKAHETYYAAWKCRNVDGTPPEVISS